MRRIEFVGSHFAPGFDVEHGMVVLRECLRALTNINEDMMRRLDLPLLYESGVRYQREPHGVEEWQDALETVRRGHGDCEDLASYRAAELRVRYGIPAIADFTLREVPQEDGSVTRVFHIIVRGPGGYREDPSRLLGMGARPAHA